MKYFIGVDPDMHTTPIAVIDENGHVTRIEIATVPKSLTGREALVEMCKQLHRCDIFRSNFGVGGQAETALTVEGQELYQFGPDKTKNPKSIMFLATVAGAALERWIHVPNVYFPTPQEWKGSVPKQVHQARILSRIGWGYEKHGSVEDGWCSPTHHDAKYLADFGLKPAHWKHAVDAIGLAQWGREKYLEEISRKERSQTCNGYVP